MSVPLSFSLEKHLLTTLKVFKALTNKQKILFFAFIKLIWA